MAVRPINKLSFEAFGFTPALRTIGGFLVITILLAGLLSCSDNSKKEASPQKEISYSAKGKDISVAAWDSELPADIVLIIDQSGSMSRGKFPTDPKALRVQGSRAFLEFVAGRSRTDLPNRFGVINFGSEAPRKYSAALSQISSTEDQSIHQIGGRLVPLDLGDTSFIKALRLAVELLEEGGSFKKSGNRAIVVFTDGEPDDERKLNLANYFEELKEFAARELKPRQVSLFIVGIDTVGKRWSGTVSRWQELLGKEYVFSTPSMEALKDQFGRIVQRVWHLPEVGAQVVSSKTPQDFDVEPYLAAVEFHLFPSQKGLKLNIYRPGGKIVKPGEDLDSPAVSRLSTFDRLVVQEPEPGRWRYEVVGGEGKVEVLRNPIPLRMNLVNPSPVHPQGKPILVTAEFKRNDGKPVVPHPDYPLGLAADVVTPTGQRIPLKFPVELARNGVYIAEPQLEDTAVSGEYRINLKVSGGGRYLTQHPVSVQVKPIPYLLIEEPSEKNPVALKNEVSVNLQLLLSGKPLAPQGAFSNHPDYLVTAQIIKNPKGAKGKAVWLPIAEKSGSPGKFAGTVPLPETLEGDHLLAVKIAPEEPEKAKWSDQTVAAFITRTPPRPLWMTIGLWALGIVPVLLIAGWQARRFYKSRIKLVFYFWAQGESSCQIVSFDKAEGTRVLHGLPIEAVRVGGAKSLTLKPVGQTRLFSADQQEIKAFEARGGGRILFQTDDTPPCAVHFDFSQPPSCPEPPENPETHEVPVTENKPAESEEKPIDWGFGSTTH